MLSRRTFLQLMAASSGFVLADQRGILESASAAAAIPSGLLGGSGGITHVVVLMLENRSFDHLLGWLPGADGNLTGSFLAPDGNSYPNYPLAPDFQGCGYSDPDHSWEGWLVENNNGAHSGFLMRPTTTEGTPGIAYAATNTFPIGYYTNFNPDGSTKSMPDVPVLGALAQNYTVLDRYFCSFAGETYPNRFYQHSAQTDRDHNSPDGSSAPTISTLPTIWDQLSPTPSTTQPTGAYFFKDIPFLALWGTKYVPFWRPWADGQTLPGFGTVPGLSFLDTVAQRLLPNVTFVDPAFEDEGSGTSGDYHPLSDIRVGEKFVSDVYFALSDAGYLDSTVLVVTFDEWGGFFEHVSPPQVVDHTNPANVNHGGNNRPAGFPGPNYPDYTQLGFRVPAIIVSNYTTPQIISEGPFEHASTLAMIESMFGLTPLTARDANALNLSQVLGSTLRPDDPSTLIPRSADVPGPATGAAAACSALSTPAVPPNPVPPAVTPEFPISPVIPVAIVATAGLAALAAHNRRVHAAAGVAVDPVTSTVLPEPSAGPHLGPAVPG
jgi:phospholipase C